MDLKQKIELAWDNRDLLNDSSTIKAINDTIELVDSGKLRVAQLNQSKWIVNEWVKKAVLLYFPINKMTTLQAGPLEFYDKIPLKRDYAKKRNKGCPKCYI